MNKCQIESAGFGISSDNRGSLEASRRLQINHQLAPDYLLKKFKIIRFIDWFTQVFSILDFRLSLFEGLLLGRFHMSFSRLRFKAKQFIYGLLSSSVTALIALSSCSAGTAPLPSRRCFFSTHATTPVLPNPPSPRSVTHNSSTT
jgi:hypothetical protein